MAAGRGGMRGPRLCCENAGARAGCTPLWQGKEGCGFPPLPQQPPSAPPSPPDFTPSPRPSSPRLGTHLAVSLSPLEASSTRVIANQRGHFPPIQQENWGEQEVDGSRKEHRTPTFTALHWALPSRAAVLSSRAALVEPGRCSALHPASTHIPCGDSTFLPRPPWMLLSDPTKASHKWGWFG